MDPKNTATAVSQSCASPRHCGTSQSTQLNLTLKRSFVDGYSAIAPIAKIELARYVRPCNRVLLYETASTHFSSCPWSEYIDQHSWIASLPVRLTVIAFLSIAFKGVFEIHDIILGTTICPRHRDRFGIWWRRNKKNRARPHEWASHMAVKEERGLNLAPSQKLQKLLQVLIPVASRKF